MNGRAVLAAFALVAAMGGCRRVSLDDELGLPSGFASAAVAPGAGPGEDALRAARSGSLAPFSSKLPAVAGDYALVPSRAAIAEVLALGIERQTVVYYGAWLQELEERESRVRWLTQQRGTVPNAFIVPIRRGERVEPGTVVLTAWAAGSGLQRAIVVPGGKPESPRVRYLDMTLDDPTGFGQKEDTLPEHTFHALRTPGEAGTTLACGAGTRRERYVALKTAGEELLALGFAGRLAILPAGSCTPLAIVPEVRVGDRVEVPVVGSFLEARVAGVDAEIGRVRVEYEFGTETRKTAVGYTNVAPSSGSAAAGSAPRK